MSHLAEKVACAVPVAGQRKLAFNAWESKSWLSAVARLTLGQRAEFSSRRLAGIDLRGLPVSKLKTHAGFAVMAAMALLAGGAAQAAVTVPVTMMDGLPVVQVKLGSIKADFLLDTGGAVAITVPPPLIVPSAGVTQLSEKTKTTDASGAVHEVNRIKVQDAYIGEARVGELDGLVNYSWGLSLDKSEPAPDVTKKGIVGLKAFERKGVIFDLGRGKLMVLEPNEVPEMPGKWSSAPLKVDRRGAVVTMSLNGKDAELVLDSAATMTVMKRGAAALTGQNNVCKGKPADAGVCGPTTFRRVGLGDGTLKRMEFLVVTMGPLPFDGMLGIDFFKSNVVYLDFAKGRMHFMPL